MRKRTSRDHLAIDPPLAENGETECKRIRDWNREAQLCKHSVNGKHWLNSGGANLLCPRVGRTTRCL